MSAELLNLYTSRHLITACKTDEVCHDTKHTLYYNPHAAKCTTKNAKK